MKIGRLAFSNWKIQCAIDVANGVRTAQSVRDKYFPHSPHSYIQWIKEYLQPLQSVHDNKQKLSALLSMKARSYFMLNTALEAIKNITHSLSIFNYVIEKTIDKDILWIEPEHQFNEELGGVDVAATAYYDAAEGINSFGITVAKGLSDAEADVYVNLLEEEINNPGQLSKQQTALEAQRKQTLAEAYRLKALLAEQDNYALALIFNLL